MMPMTRAIRHTAALPFYSLGQLGSGLDAELTKGYRPQCPESARGKVDGITVDETKINLSLPSPNLTNFHLSLEHFGRYPENP